MQLFARTCKFDRMNIERFAARTFVVTGGLFWFVAAMGAVTRYLEEDAGDVLTQAWVLLGLTMVVLAIGWFYEVLAAMILFALTALFIAWGFVNPAIGETGVWAIWLLFTAAPASTAAALFLLAARMQKICEYEGVIKTRPE